MRRLLLWCLVAIVAAVAAAQSLSFLPSFDAVTVKPFVGTVTRGIPPRADPGRLTIEHSTPEQMIAYAYGVNINQIAGLPDWARHDRFQVTGVTHVPARPEQLKLMLRRALADRFQLALTETHAVQPVDALEVAPSGLKMKPWTSPAPCQDALPAMVREKVPQLPRPLVSTFASCEIADLVTLLNGSPTLTLPVVDKTGLTGPYAIFVWQGLQTSPGGARRPEHIQDAIRRELGLILVKTTAPWPMLHITQIAHPTPDQ